MTILVIVESRAKAPKIEGILGKGYTVRPCYGHVQDVQHSLKWIDAHATSGWDPDTIPYCPGTDALNKKTMTELRRLTKQASKVIIASDMDREGEAIGYHLCELLKLKQLKIPAERIVFDQITPEAIREAVANPTTLREPMYRAQQARRVIDLLFGYTVSPLLWGIAHKLSAGRCQSPALRWVWERQQQFLDTKDVEPKFEITAKLVKAKTDTQGIASLQGTYQRKKRSGKDDHDPALLKTLVQFREWIVMDTTASQPHQKPPIPFTTSTLQQKAYSRWKWSPKRTMSVAQKLYEGGHITYMRTDCKVLSAPFVAQASEHIRKRFGTEYLNTHTRTSKISKKQAHAQEAHEPVRPVHAHRQCLSQSQATAEGQKLYQLIYETTLSSLMTPCILNKVVVVLQPTAESKESSRHLVKAECSEMHFPGHRVWEVLDQLPWVARVPNISIGHIYNCQEYQSTLHHPITNKPYTSGDLLKLLETRGVGRPSTYSSILETLENRKYVMSGEAQWVPVLKDHPLSSTQNKDVRILMQHTPPQWEEKILPTDIVKSVKDRYHVTPLGSEVISYLVTHLADMIEAEFTKSLEDDLDLIVQGQKTYPEVVNGFYTILKQRIASVKAINTKPTGPTFVNGQEKRILHDTDTWQIVAMQTKYGPSVAYFYKDAKRKKEGWFANIRPEQLGQITYPEAKRLLDEKKASEEKGDTKTGVLVGSTPDGIDVHAKSGPYGDYLVWTDAEGRLQTTTFTDKTMTPSTITLELAMEWMNQAQLTLHKVSALYTVKYNAKKDKVYLSKSLGKGKRGRPQYAPMDTFSKGDLDKFKSLSIKDCDALMDAAVELKRARGKTASTGRGRGKAASTSSGRGRSKAAAAGGGRGRARGKAKRGSSSKS